MERIRLLFSNETNYEKWCHKKITSISYGDLNIKEFSNFLEKINPEFDSNILLKPCIDISDATYRLDIMEEILENNDLFLNLKTFISTLKDLMRELTVYSDEVVEVQKKYRYINLLSSYFKTITTLEDITKNLYSSGLKKLYSYATNIIRKEQNFNIQSISKNILSKLKEILNNNLLEIDNVNKLFIIKKGIKQKSETEILKNKILEVFDVDINNYFSIVDPAPLSNMEEKILNEMIKDNKEVFENIEELYNNSIYLLDDIKYISVLYEELVFYITYIEFLNLVNTYNISYCKPEFSNKYIAKDSISPSLITAFIENNKNPLEIITNDIELPKNNMFILSGPNQGGKSIYLKTVGINAYLSKCGCFVFSKSQQIPFYDEIYTHFIQEEVIGKGKLIEEVERIEDILLRINENSLVLLNESFTSTRRKDGVKLAIHYINQILKKGTSIGFVTHYYEIANLYFDSSKIISLSAMIGNDGKRNYKIIKNMGNTSSYAKDIAKKCNMTYEDLRESFLGDDNEKG